MPMPTFPLAQLGQFRSELHACFPRRADALFELGDALLCAPAITSVARLSLEPSHRRGWGSAYDALANGRINVDWLRDLLVRVLPPADPLHTADRIVLSRILLGRVAARHGFGVSFVGARGAVVFFCEIQQDPALCRTAELSWPSDNALNELIQKE